MNSFSKNSVIEMYVKYIITPFLIKCQDRVKLINNTCFTENHFDSNKTISVRKWKAWNRIGEEGMNKPLLQLDRGRFCSTESASAYERIKNVEN